MTQAISSHGTLLQIGDGGSPETFTTIAEVGDISGPSFSVDVEEVTSHDSAGWREYVPTLVDAEELEFTINLILGHPTHGPSSGLYQKLTARARNNYRLVFPTTPAQTCTFPATVVGFELEAPVAGVLRANVTLRVVGAPVWS
jgi:hypothetical protein